MLPRRLFLHLRLKLRRLLQDCTSGVRSLYSLMARYKNLSRYLFATACGRFGMCFFRVGYRCVFVILCILWSSFIHLAKLSGRRLLHNLKPSLHCSSLINCSKGNIRCFRNILSIVVVLSMSFMALRCNLAMSVINFRRIIGPQMLRQ